MFVYKSTENEIPIFQKTVNIIVKDDEAFLLTAKVVTEYSDEHLNGFRIEVVDDVFAVIYVSDLICYQPYDQQFSAENNERTYIVPYCCFV